MTLEEKICQLFYTTPESLTGYDTVTMAGDATKQALEKTPVGGLIYFSKNLVDRDQTAAMLANTKTYGKIPSSSASTRRAAPSRASARTPPWAAQRSTPWAPTARRAIPPPSTRPAPRSRTS